MTGPEHYVKAQGRLGLQTVPGQILQMPPTELDVAIAHTHALLALTAAVLDATNAIVAGKRIDDEWCVTGEYDGRV